MFVDSFEYKVLQALLKHESSPDFDAPKYVPINEIKVACEAAKVDFETIDETERLLKVKHAIANLVEGSFIKQ